MARELYRLCNRCMFRIFGSWSANGENYDCFCLAREEYIQTKNFEKECSLFMAEPRLTEIQIGVKKYEKRF